MEIILFVLLLYLIYNFTKNPKDVISALGISILLFIMILLLIMLILKYVI